MRASCQVSQRDRLESIITSRCYPSSQNALVIPSKQPRDPGVDACPDCPRFSP
ncbi:hypothetical protein X777_04127 [Ooceraea biroi]|uniref:Uncharacterized protein n=1 Tax=Ooceraea biroi TaxID=2015173 RepID=A0A026WIU8_OOCBI|nr:hypothetical protein X777_04127 [Ooceraea biroi]